MPYIHNEELKPLIRDNYTLDDIHAISELLKQKGTFDFPRLANGLFSAAATTDENEYTGYSNVWVRDNLHVAYAHYITGKIDVAVKTVQAIKKFYKAHRHRLEGIVRGELDPAEPMNRPHVRFNGSELKENEEKWAHAQNDALGMLMWLYSLMAHKGHIFPQKEDLELLGLLVLYFQTIGFHEDEDSGHWEETRKVNASSIGMVTAGLQGVHQLLYEKLGMLQVSVGEWNVVNHVVEDEIKLGLDSLYSILPSECVQEDPAKNRRYDASLLFLLFPTQVVEGDLAEQIVTDVTDNLQGEYGIRRYLGDSYWCADYRTKMSEKVRTGDFSDNIAGRDALLSAGEEAQWCIFDPTLSSFYGLRFHETHEPEALARQTEHLNRSLGQITDEACPFGAFKCPESYFLENGNYVPNDVTPLLWTQANLKMALHFMQRSLSEK
ncbi:MAG: glycoside hydrolase family 15 protein [Planctomycetota bacterium]|nr:glycoside hydrolase family 15 protein [Planctomycetota bacterium]MDA1137409.1 glycoside hydrolase family 15 protein [Planctomycetota bacterium]